MIGIISYGCGNVGSVLNMLSKIDVWAEIVDDSANISKYNAIILPGVGSYDNGVDKLKANGFWDAIIEHVVINKKPVLGICLGMQLLFEGSEEGVMKGFGWLPGKVAKFKEDALRIPHIGWNEVSFNKDLFNECDKQEFYFVHSFHAPFDLREDLILGKSNYGDSFPAVVKKENIIGIQFHPEKSLIQGMNLLSKWVEYVKENGKT